MEIVIYTTFSWFVIVFLLTHTRREEIIRSIILYSILSMLPVSIFTFISLNLKLIYMSIDVTRFIILLLCRYVLIPLITIICINFFYRLTSYKKIFPIIIMMLLVTMIEFTYIKLEIYSYLKWNLGFTVIIYALIALFILIVSKYINISQRKERV